jgi:hypothetical protein
MYVLQFEMQTEVSVINYSTVKIMYVDSVCVTIQAVDC